MINYRNDPGWAIGLHWINILKLKKVRGQTDLYQTDWGDKTPFGIYLTIRRLVKENNTGE